MVPANALSIQFKALQFFPRPFTLSLDGQTLPLVSLEVAPTYTLYGADVTPFAGSNREMRFTAFTPDGGLNNVYLDSIQFSNQPIPEPSVYGLFALGALLLGWRWRKNSRNI